jgi:hypothetical protein
MTSDTPNPSSASTSTANLDVITDGVITAYIHAISERHRHVAPRPRRLDADA